MYIFEMALNVSVFLVPIQEKIKINKCQHKQSRFICNLWMQCNVFPPVWCFMKGGRKCYNYKSCPHWMAVISELHHFCFPGENPIDTNNDYHVLINCYLFDMGRAFSLCYYFFSFVKMLYAQHNYSLGRSSFPFLCVCSFTSTDAFMLNKCLILVIAYRIFLHSTPPYRVWEALPCFTYHPNFLFLKHRSGFSDFFTK